MMDRRLIENFDWALMLVLFGIVGAGLLALYSALYPQIQANPSHNLFVKQVMWLGVGLVVLLSSLTVEYQRLKSLNLWFYLSCLVLLVIVLVVGKEVNGSKRWLNILGVQFQPSELMKILIVIHLASYFSAQEIFPYPTFRQLIIPVVSTLVPVLLILAEPDLGTALCIMTISVTMIFFMGVRWKYIFALLGTVALLSWPAWVRFLKPYQKKRILILLCPDLDPLGAGYHIRQSKIAIGSGMLWGKGFLNGTQNKLHFLPEKHTDFIFSVFSEEWGFVGCIVLLILFGILIMLALSIARRSKSRFGALLVIGMTGLILWQVVINIGMVNGLLPVVGIPLPFVSYGGSSLISLCFAIGVIENVSMRRYVFHSQ